MEPGHAVLIAVAEERDSVLVGRTLLQKKIYFAAALLGQDMDFRPHHYGPYSRRVADATDSQVSNRFLEEQVEVFPADDNVFGERRRHSYRLTEDGKQLLKSVNSEPDAANWHAAFRKINGHPVATDFNLLSIAAKVATIRANVGERTAEEVSRQASAYGWQLSASDISRVDAFLKHLGLARP